MKLQNLPHSRRVSSELTHLVSSGQRSHRKVDRMQVGVPVKHLCRTRQHWQRVLYHQAAQEGQQLP